MGGIQVRNIRHHPASPMVPHSSDGRTRTIPSQLSPSRYSHFGCQAGLFDLIPIIIDPVKLRENPSPTPSQI